jgi:hypothetical protein
LTKTLVCRILLAERTLMSDSTLQYLVRDSQGNVYGPADEGMLREWVQQGRITAGMHVAPRETREWMEATQHPALADLFAAGRTDATLGPPTPLASPLEEPPASAPFMPQAPAEPPPEMAVSAPLARRVPEAPQTGAVGTVTLTGGYSRPVVDPYGETPRANPLALAGFIFGVAGLVISVCPCSSVLTIPFGITAIVLAAAGLHQIKLNPPRFTGQGLGIAAIAMGALAFLAGVLWAAFWLFSGHL